MNQIVKSFSIFVAIIILIGICRVSAIQSDMTNTFTNTAGKLTSTLNYNPVNLPNQFNYIVAIYNSTHLVCVDMKSVDQTTVTGSVSITMLMPIGASEYHAKAFVWSDTNIQPLGEETFVGTLISERIYINNTSDQITYSGMVNTNVDTMSYLENDVHIATEVRSYAEYTFVGTGIDVLSVVSQNGGRIRVFIDDIFDATISTYNTEKIKATVVYTKAGLLYGKHKIKIEKATGKEMVLDGFKVYTTPIRMACVGDSITVNTGIGSPNAYPTHLAPLLGNGYQVGNFGRSGETLVNYNNVVEYLNSIAFAPDIVIIMLGTNDSVDWGINKSIFYNKYVSLIQSYDSLPSKPNIYIGTSPTVHPNAVWGSYFKDEIISGEVKEMTLQVAASTGCSVIDINTLTKYNPDLFYDGVHTNSAGAKFIAQEMANRIPLKKE